VDTNRFSHEIAVYIGRFQPFHAGHAALLQRALEIAPQCVVVIGSAFQARTPKNPFTWEERAEMIRLSLAPADRSRLRFLPLRDYYDQERWAAAVRRGVGTGSIALVGHFKDPTSEYLRAFPGWALVSVERQTPVDATSIRAAYFGSGRHDLEATLGAMVNQAPATTLHFLQAWSELAPFAELAGEWHALKAYHDAWAVAPYPPVFVTVDAVVRCAGHVLLIERAHAPGRGLLALPGGFIEQRETVLQSCLRELVEETHLALPPDMLHRCLRDVVVFDHPDRSQRGRTITHAHLFDLGERALPEVRADDDARSVQWTPIERLATLEDRFHDDHFHMLDHFFALTLDAPTGGQTAGAASNTPSFKAGGAA
jgi:bifunctional NMN adenylyltransferase/nudix hydrolase